MQLSSFDSALIDDNIPWLKSLPEDFWLYMDDLLSQSSMHDAGLHLRGGNVIIAINPPDSLLTRIGGWSPRAHSWCFFKGRVIHFFRFKEVTSKLSIGDFFLDFWCYFDLYKSNNSLLKWGLAKDYLDT